MDHSQMDHGGMGHGDMDMGDMCSMNVWLLTISPTHYETDLK